MRNSLFYSCLGLVYLLSFFFLCWNNPFVEEHKPEVEGDGLGLYSYLPRLFIEGDLQYNHEDDGYAAPYEDTYVNKTFVGTALLQLPFFAAGHGVALLSGFEADGYSEPYVFALHVGTICYAVIGLFLLHLLLRRRFRVRKSIAQIVVLFIALGSPLFYYTAFNGLFSHAYSFFAVAAFLWQGWRTARNESYQNIVLLALVFSLVVVVRPVNALVLLALPAVYQRFGDFLALLGRLLSTRRVIPALVAMAVPLFMQFAVWYLQTGEWFIWSYSQEGFRFSDPHILEVLFGFNRGLFVYGPVLLLALAGWLYLAKNRQFLFITLGFFFFLFTFITASWWHYTYGETYSIRPFTDVMAVFAIPMAIGLDRWSPALRKTAIGLGILATALQMAFALQYHMGILKVNNITPKKFTTLFLEFSDDYKDYFGGSTDVPPYAPFGYDTLATYPANLPDFSKDTTRVNGDEFLHTIKYDFPGKPYPVRHLWIETGFDYRFDTLRTMREVYFVIHVFNQSQDSTRMYTAFRANEYPDAQPGKWHHAHHTLWLPLRIEKGDHIRLYLWNRLRKDFILANYQTRLMTPRQE